MSEVKVGTSRSSIYNLQVPNDDNLSADQTTDTDFVTRIGKKSDAAAVGPVTSTDSIMAYLKQLVTEGAQGGILAIGYTLTDLTTGDVFSITGGLVKVKEIIGRVTTAIENQATVVSLDFDPDNGGANVDLTSNTGDIDNLEPGTLIRMTHDFSEDMIISGDEDDAIEGTDIQPTGTILGPGDVIVTFGAASTGAITWYMLYESLGGVVEGLTTQSA
jgi:hypothetical protein